MVSTELFYKAETMKSAGIIFAVLVMTLHSVAQDAPKEKNNDLEELKEIKKLMEDSEEALLAASLGKAALEQEEIMKLLEKLTKEEREAIKKNPKLLTDKFFQKSKKRQKQTITRIEDLIKRAKARQDDNKPSSERPKGPKNPFNPQPPDREAQNPHVPRAKSPVSKFRSIADREGEWGDLPPKEREAILHERRAIDRFPPEFQEMLKEYWKQLMKEVLVDN